jgi:anti-anti-sigma factor
VGDIAGLRPIHSICLLRLKFSDRNRAVAASLAALANLQEVLMAAHSMGPATDLKIEVASSPSEALVRCSGKITVATTDALLGQVRPLIPENKRVVLDLAQISYIDSSGLGAIVRLWSTAGKSNCAFKITNLAPGIKELLAMTNLTTIFES